MGLERGLNVLVPIFYRNIGEGGRSASSALSRPLFGLVRGGGPNLGRWDSVRSWIIRKRLWLVPGSVSSEECPGGHKWSLTYFLHHSELVD